MLSGANVGNIELPILLYGTHYEVVISWRNFVQEILSFEALLEERLGKCVMCRLDQEEPILFFRRNSVDSCTTDHVPCWRLYPICNQLGEIWYPSIPSDCNLSSTILPSALSYNWFVMSLTMFGLAYPAFLDDRARIASFGFILLKKFVNNADALLAIAGAAVGEPGFYPLSPVELWAFPHQLALCCGWDHNYLTLLEELSQSHITNCHLLKRIGNDVDLNRVQFTIDDVVDWNVE